LQTRGAKKKPKEQAGRKDKAGQGRGSSPLENLPKKEGLREEKEKIRKNLDFAFGGGRRPD